jgi:hypothetical protein
MANRASKLSRGATRFGFFQLDSMIVTADAVETGVTEMIEMLQRHAESLLQEARDTARATVHGGGVGAALTVQARFMGFLGKKGFSVAWEAAGISLKTIKNAAQPFWSSRP